MSGILQCPQCGTQLIQDFGVFPCGKCGVMLSVDFEGRVHVPDSTGAEENTGSNVSDEFSSGLLPSSDSEGDIASSGPEIEPIHEVPFESLSQIQLPPSSVGMEILSEANDVNGVETLPFKYLLKIGGLDTADIRSQFLEVISDRKFRFEARELMGKINDQGQIVLEDLSAAKVSILVRRLQSLPVQLHWEQSIGS